LQLALCHPKMYHPLARRCVGTSSIHIAVDDAFPPLQSNRDAIGATLRLQGRESVIHRNVYGGGSYASSSERVVHFGMAKSQLQNGRFPQLTVRWPSGTTTTHDLLEADQLIRLVEPAKEKVE
ncbi:MAG: ASPIC/UnbV domain-containing protein, partial [Pirellulaceae bacterium]